MSASPHLTTRAIDFGRTNAAALTRWFATGLAFMAITTGMLYVLVDLFGLRVIWATLIAAEAATLLRFVINEYWVFATRAPTRKRLVQYHLANATATAVWWLAANVLTWLGVHHLLAAALAVGVSTGFSLGSNFFWVWRNPSPSPTTPPAA